MNSPVAILRCFAVAMLALQMPSHTSSQNMTSQSVNVSNQKLICEQPFYYNILPKTEEILLLDHVCLTFFPLPDDPNTFSIYASYVYCDGSNSIISYVSRFDGQGSFTSVTPMGTFGFHYFGYAGCDTYLAYTVTMFGQAEVPPMMGVSSNPNPVGLSCLRKIDEVIQNAGFPEMEMYILPNKLPPRCVNQPMCTAPPNPFYTKLPPSVGLV